MFERKTYVALRSAKGVLLQEVKNRDYASLPLAGVIDFSYYDILTDAVEVEGEKEPVRLESQPLAHSKLHLVDPKILSRAEVLEILGPSAPPSLLESLTVDEYVLCDVLGSLLGGIGVQLRGVMPITENVVVVRTKS